MDERGPVSADQLREQTKRFALHIVRLFRALPKTEEARIIGRQVLRSGTSVGANYRAACRSRSRAEFLAKLGVVVEEADETVFWIELLSESRIIQPESTTSLLREAEELLYIFSAARRTAKQNHQLAQSPTRQIN